MNPGAEHLKDEVHRALDLLGSLSKPNPPQSPLGELNPKAIKHCRGIFFFHTRKVGLALGIKWGAGVLLAHILDENGHESWSAPVLYKVNEVSLGLLAGVGNIQTMLILGSEKAVDHFRVGGKKGPVVLGQDLSLGKALGFAAVEDANIFASRDVISHSLADGAIVDWSLIGGKISVDKDANAAIYGKDADLEKAS
ncbi:hypothetical protein WJX75_001922 [Coccomyxa subellipsoidea]|uniref:Ysc84 actin-binding domain-containing protein n=1 Tax=Coccomyxa subellipsoidea TaxID=248742 RepID=A0ABR2YRD0_9CHLO